MTQHSRKFQLPLFFFILSAFIFILGGVWSVIAQEDVLPLPAASGSDRAFSQVQQLTASDGVTNDGFGWRVALDGDLLIEGNLYPDDYTGAAYIFERNASGVWNEIVRLAADDATVGDSFGYDVALEGTTAVIGAPVHGGIGAVYIFGRDTLGTWTQQQKLSQPGLPANSAFGSAIAIDGDRIVIAAQSAKIAYVYQRNNSQIWQYETELVVEDAIYDIAIEDEYILIGTPYEGPYDFGAAHLYQLVGGGWTFAKKLEADDGGSLEYFGSAVALHGGQAFITSEIYNSSGRGSVYVFSPDGDEWAQSQKLTPNDAADEDFFGQAIALDQQKMAVGSFGDGGGAGSVYLFGWDGSAWVQEQKIAAVGDYFGYSVDLQAEVLVSGAILANGSKGKVYIYSDPDLLPTAVPTITNTPSPVTTATPEPSAELLVNGGFENSDTGWTVKNATGDKVKCNKPAKTFSYAGDCAWRFKGGAGENAKIQQVITTGVDAGDVLTLSGYVNASGAANGKLKVVVTYADGVTPKNKITINLTSPTSGYIPLSSLQPALTLNVAASVQKVKPMIKNSSTSGKVYYDALSLSVQ